MSQTFDVVLSKSLTPEEIAKILGENVPPGLRIDVRREMSDLPDEPGAIWALVSTTNDSDWPCVLSFLICSDECGLGSWPDLRIADWLHRRHGVNSLCSTYTFAGELDPYDPYWFLACVGGKWFLADTCGTALLGPYSDHVHRFPGEEKVRLIRPVEVPEMVFA